MWNLKEKVKNWHHGHFLPSNCIFNSQWPLNIQEMSKKTSVMGSGTERWETVGEKVCVNFQREALITPPKWWVREMECPHCISLYADLGYAKPKPCATRQQTHMASCSTASVWSWNLQVYSKFTSWLLSQVNANISICFNLVQHDQGSNARE